MYVRAIYIPLSSCEISSRVLDPPVSKEAGVAVLSFVPTLTLRRLLVGAVVDLPSPYLPSSQNPKPRSTERSVTPVSWAVCRAAIKPTFWQIASVFIMWEYFCGRHPARKHTRAIGTTFAGLERELVMGVLFTLSFERSAKARAVLLQETYLILTIAFV